MPSVDKADLFLAAVIIDVISGPARADIFERERPHLWRSTRATYPYGEDRGVASGIFSCFKNHPNLEP